MIDKVTKGLLLVVAGLLLVVCVSKTDGQAAPVRAEKDRYTYISGTVPRVLACRDRASIKEMERIYRVDNVTGEMSELGEYHFLDKPGGEIVESCFAWRPVEIRTPKTAAAPPSTDLPPSP